MTKSRFDFWRSDLRSKSYLKKKLRELDRILHTFDLYNNNDYLSLLYCLDKGHFGKSWFILDLERREIRKQLKEYKGK